MYDFGARSYDNRLGRWLSVGPLQIKYPSLSPYNFCGDNPIFFVDPDGKEIRIYLTETEYFVHKPEVSKHLSAAALKAASEAGNYLWGMLYEYDGETTDFKGGWYSPALAADIKTIEVQGRVDEANEQRAIKVGQKQGDKIFKR